jgi:hypothetical protein
MSGSLSTPSLDLDFTQGVLPAGLTFFRNSVGTNSFYTDAPGSTYTSYAASVPRFIGGGLYTEETRTNFLLNSDAPATQTLASLGAPANNVYILWVIGTGSATVTAGTGISSTTLPITATAGNPASFVLTTAGTMVVTVTGSLTRFQLERAISTSGVSFPTSYIPTTGTFVARGADLCTMPLDVWFNPAASTYYVQASESFLNINACVPFGAYVGASRSGLLHRASGNISLSDAVAGVVDLPGGVPPLGVIYQAAGAFRNGRQSGSLNGGAAAVGVAASIQSGLTTLGVGSANSSLFLCGTIYRARYWPTDLANADLQAITLAPVLDLNLTGPTLDPKLTLTRSTTGTYVDNTGTIRTAAINAPRFGYHPSTLAPLGLLIEEMRTNLETTSVALAGWSVSPAACLLTTDNVTVSPDGTTNASSVVTNDTAASGHLIYRPYNGAINTTYVGSVFVKANAYTRVSMAFGNTAFPAGNTGGLFDLAAGTIVATSGATVCTIVPYPNGWYRVSATATSTGTGGSYVFGFFPAPATVTVVAQNYTPASTGLGIFAWGPQVETSAFVTAPTSYIPTTAGAVTRTADVCSMPAGAPWYSPTLGSFAVDATMQQVNAGNQDIVGFDDGSTNNCTLARCTANSFYIIEASAGVGQASANTQNTIVPGVPFRAAMTYNAGVLTGALNGGAVVTSTGTPPVSSNRLNLSAIRQATQNGFKSRIRYWPRVLSNIELQELTSTGVQARAMVLA